MSDFTPEKIESTRKQLARFSCLQSAPDLSAEEQQSVITAILWFSELADYETLGICADSLTEGKAALEAYVTNLSQPIKLDLDARAGAVYLKFNTLKGTWYLDDYPGPSRGVLISFHTSEPGLDAINGTFGPFPLDLFSA